MSRDSLSSRSNWQTESGPAGLSGQTEENLIKAFQKAFEGTCYEIDKHPKEFKHLYDNITLDADILEHIYCPDCKIMDNARKRGWGVTPDFAIKNKETGKMLFGEIKRQDGWVEGKKPSAGRGNAHERMCKLFTPGMIEKYREESGIKDTNILPFWIVLAGDITRDPKRNREIAFWFGKYDKNYFMWRPDMTDKELIEHFDRYLRPYID